MKLLLSHNCNIKLAAQDDMNALHFASQKGHTEVIRLLITAGEEPWGPAGICVIAEDSSCEATAWP